LPWGRKLRMPTAEGIKKERVGVVGINSKRKLREKRWKSQGVTTA